jgi:His-Xaa-Ser system protein HxsD
VGEDEHCSESGQSTPLDWDFSIRLSAELYPHDRVLRACYSMAERASFWLDKQEGNIVVHCRAKDRGASRSALQNELLDALIDHSLRQAIEAQTTGIREVLVRTALAEARSP